MDKLVTVLAIAILAVQVVICILILTRKQQGGTDDSGREIQKSLELTARQTDAKLDATAKQTDSRFEQLSKQMQDLTNRNYEQQIRLMETLNANSDKQSQAISKSIESLQQSNEKKLDQMRNTVDEKLTETLNKRINASFEQVSKQLQDVYKSLGEMKELSSGVTDNVKGLNRVLTNVKTNPKYNGQVEFAVKIPSAEGDSITWLPVDSKFPMEDYARLQEASEAGDIEALAKAKKALEQRVLGEGKAIKNYISTPETTPFAIMYLATEGLYAEIMSGSGAVAEKLQAEGIMVAGPSTITALLNSLAMGFRSIAINQKATEVWKVLGAAKAQYDKFGDLLAKAKKKVDEAGKVLDEADHRNSIIQKNLRNVESLDSGEAGGILGIED